MNLLSSQAYKLFDDNALKQQEDGLDMRRVIKARDDLGKAIGKMKKSLKQLYHHSNGRLYGPRWERDKCKINKR